MIEETSDDADFVFVTHDDRDHYDSKAIRAVLSNHTEIAVYERIDINKLDRDTTPLPYRGEMTIDEIEIRTVPAYNRRDGKHIRDTSEPYHSVYFVSDSDFLDEHRDIEADALIPPIGIV